MSTKWRYAILITGVYLLLHLFLMKDYGVSWDYHYHFYAGLYHLGLPVPSMYEKSPVPFTPPDPRLTVEDPFGPMTQILPSLSQVVLADTFHLLPFDVAYDLPMVIIGSLGVGLLFIFLYESAGAKSAFFGAFFLGFLPSYFAYIHTNMKDVPNAFFFALSIYCFWKLMNSPTRYTLLAASLSFALAFNTKINSIFIPPVCLIWAGISKKEELKRLISSRKIIEFFIKNRYILSYFILAPISALIIWWPFWKNPLQKLMELPVFYSLNTINMPVLFNGSIIRSGVSIPWYYPFVYLAVAMPIGLLCFFVIGLVFSFLQISKKKSNIYSLFLLWFFIPLIRYAIPKAGAIDGIRHFMEVVYPLCAISGIGAAWFVGTPVIHRFIKGVALSLVFLSLVSIIVRFHPYEASFYNRLIGGLSGAQGKFDVDFWGTPQREAMMWLNDHAPSNSTIHIVMAQSSAALYLRPDLAILANTKNVKESDYTVILNKESFFEIYPVREYLKEQMSSQHVVFTVTREHAGLVWVIKNGKKDSEKI